jgi:hypothetical protein
MAISYAAALRTTRITAVLTALNVGSGGAKIKLYNGTRGNVGGSTLLATLLLPEPAGVVSGAILTLDCDPVLTATVAAGATATGMDATWAQLTTNADGLVATLDVTGLAGNGDIKLSNVTLIAGGEVSISAATITEGNA